MKDTRFWPFVGPAIVAVLISLYEALDMSPSAALHYGVAFTGSGLVAFLVASAIILTRNGRRWAELPIALVFFTVAGVLAVVGIPLGIMFSVVLTVSAFIITGLSFYAFLICQ